MRLPLIIGALFVGAGLILLGAMGARWLGPESGHATAEAPVALEPIAQPTHRQPGIDLETIRQLLAVIGAKQRSQILDSGENFARFVEQETANQSILAAAYANGADRNEALEVLMTRAGERVLAEAYLNQVVSGNLAPDFPTDEQVREAYDRNPDAFRVPERMHLWQIFLPVGADADSAVRAEVLALAKRISGEIRAGKSTFAAMAKAHSAHDASRLNDGYMGVIKVSELLPAVAEAAAALEVDGVSDPVSTDSGLHIIKRGQTIAAEMLPFDAVRDRVRTRLRREAALKIRRAAVEKIVEQYPIEGPSADLETWRSELGADAAGG